MDTSPHLSSVVIETAINTIASDVFGHYIIRTSCKHNLALRHRTLEIMTTNIRTETLLVYKPLAALQQQYR